MLEPGQDLALALQALLDVAPSVPAAHDLEGDRLLERVVVAHRPVDDARAAAADLAQDAIGADPPPLQAGDVPGQRARRLAHGRPRQEAVRLGVGDEQGLDLAPQVGVAGALPVEEAAARVLWLLEDLVEDVLQSYPALVGHRMTRGSVRSLGEDGGEVNARWPLGTPSGCRLCDVP